MDPQTPIVQQYYQLYLDATSGDDVPITSQVNVSVQAQSAVATGLQLQVKSLLLLYVRHVLLCLLTCTYCFWLFSGQCQLSHAAALPCAFAQPNGRALMSSALTGAGVPLCSWPFTVSCLPLC